MTIHFLEMHEPVFQFVMQFDLGANGDFPVRGGAALAASLPMMILFRTLLFDALRNPDFSMPSRVLSKAFDALVPDLERRCEQTVREFRALQSWTHCFLIGSRVICECAPPRDSRERPHDRDHDH